MNESARERELQSIQATYRVSTEETEDQKKKKEEAANLESRLIAENVVTLTIEGSEGESFTVIPGENLDNVFSAINLPPKIKRLKFDNWLRYQALNQSLPYYRFTIDLDFGDTPILDFSRSGTNNPSNYEVNGLDETWVLGTAEKLARLAKSKRSSVRTLVHKVFHYDLLLWSIGVPGSVLFLRWMAMRMEVFQYFQDSLRSAVYLFAILFLLVLFRLSYNYMRWLFPYLELSEQPKKLQGLQRTVGVFLGLTVLSGWVTLIANYFVTR